MIQKLQRRFIAIAAIAVAVILVAVLTVVNIYNYYRVNSQINTLLTLITEYNGRMPDYRDADKVDSNDVNLNKESSYIIRYFTAQLDEDDEIQSIDTEHIAAVDDDTAKDIVENILTLTESYKKNIFHFGDDEQGYLPIDEYDGYCYSFKKTEFNDGSSMIVVIDCTSTMDSLREFRVSSVFFGLLSLGVFVFLISILSKKAIKPYLENYEKQKQFITNAGHELKTPLAIISANTEVLEMVDGENEWTQSILHQVKRMSGLLGNLLSLSRMTESEKEAVLADMDLSKATADAAESFRPVIEQQKKVLECEIEDGIHANVETATYPELVNILVDNAAKYCDDGGKVTVRLRHGAKNKGACLEVSNNYKEGEGVNYNRFFERFYRQDTSHNSKKGGYGIGLSMADMIVRRCRGKINVGWKDGIITFTVTV